MDRLGVRRPDDPRVELAEPRVRERAHGAQSLRDVRAVPPARGPRPLRVARPDRARVGHERAAQEARAPVVVVVGQVARRLAELGERCGGIRGGGAAGGGQARLAAAGRGPVWRQRRDGQVRARGARPRRQLGGLPPVAPAHRLGRGRPAGEAVADERHEGVGGGYAARAHQQRLVRRLPPEARADRERLGGQVDSRVGHVQAAGHANVPARARPFLDSRRPPDSKPARRGP
mmetsp:Transcript_15445/g.48120  ORF Transcript_15445/g.48120 Transcript_15445/m.48120 type:complete len:232 (-) Transcript_15445:1413-2108(-)